MKRSHSDDDLPLLVDLEDIKGDLQMHSTWSDGKVSIREMVDGCRERGYEYCAITDHSQAMAMVQGLTPERALWPGLAISLTVLSVNYMGDGLRDALDPRIRKR